MQLVQVSRVQLLSYFISLFSLTAHQPIKQARSCVIYDEQIVRTYQSQKPLKYAGNQSLVAVTALKGTERISRRLH